MGLDWIIGSKPKPGFDNEFKKYSKQLQILEDQVEKNYQNDDINKTIEQIKNKLNDISVSPYQTVSSLNESFDTDFRGKLIARCKFFSDDLTSRCLSDMNPSSMLELAQMIEDEIKDINSIHNELKNDYGLEIKNDFNEEIPTFEYSIKWLRFWANCGHSLYVSI